jgi:hypothetical protein
MAEVQVVQVTADRTQVVHAVTPQHTAVVDVGYAKGAKGDKGDKGDEGDPGPPGEGASYVHDQAVPAAVWTIVHGLSYIPNMTVVDSAGSQIEGDVVYGPGEITFTASAAFAGKAYLT